MRLPSLLAVCVLAAIIAVACTEFATPGNYTLNVGKLETNVYVLRPPSFLVSLRSDPPMPFRGESFNIVVKIKNEGELPGTYSGSLTTGNSTGAFTEEVPAGGEVDRVITLIPEKTAASYETIMGYRTVTVNGISLDVPIAEPISASGISFAPGAIKIGESIIATATLTNSADFQVPYQVKLSVNGELSQTRVVEVPASGSTEEVFELFLEEGGTATVAIGTFTAVVQVLNELADYLRSDYDLINPLELAAAPHQWQGTLIELFGEITNVQQYDTFTWFTLDAEVPGSSSDEPIVVRTSTPVASLVRGMFVRLYGTGEGTEEVRFRLTGATTNIPAVASDYVLIEAASTDALAELYETRYAAAASPLDQTLIKGNFEITLIEYGIFTHLTFGDRTSSLRIDVRVTNVGSKQDSIYSFNAALLDDLAGQYDASFDSTLDVRDIYPGVVREGYLLFDDLNPATNKLRLLWEDGYLPGSYDRITFEFAFDAP